MLLQGMRRQLKRALVLLLALSMVVPTFVSQSFAAVNQEAQFSDIKGHWAEEPIQAWINEGWIKGFPDGSFKPDALITRAEFMSLVNQAFGYTEEAEISFTDVSEESWYYQAVSIAIAAGYMDGYADRTMKPEDPITRQEAAKIIAAIKNLEADEEAANSFSDASSIAAWSKGFVGGVAAANIMVGYTDGSFKPLNNIARAEAVVALNQALNMDMGRVTEVIYDKAGTYEGQTIEGNAVITVSGVILKDTAITGDLTIAEEVGQGDASLENVTVKGTTFVYGGGENSVYLTDSVLPKLIVNKKDGKVRVVAKGSSKVNQVILESGAKLVEQLDSGAEGFNRVHIAGAISEGGEVVLEGYFTEVNVNAKAKIVVQAGATIEKLVVGADADGTEVSGSGTVKDKVIDPAAGNVKVSTPQGNIIGGGSGGGGPSQNDDVVSKPSKPVGTTYELDVDAPTVGYPLPSVKNGENAADGTLKNIAATNPFIKILDGFDQVWSLNQPEWRDGTALTKPGVNGKPANYGDGPTVYFDGYKNDKNAVVADKKTYANEEIRNVDTWVANIRYVEQVTQNRTDEEALAAYYDDQRDKIYSMLDAFGPLANPYVNIVKPTTSVVRDVYEMNIVLEEETAEDQSQGMGTDWANTELADMLDLVSLIRFRTPASSNPPKYFYSSPRPWRMNSNGEVVELVDENGLAVWETIGSGEKKEEALPSGGTKSTGERHFQQYESNVEVIPALKYVRRIAEDGRGKDGAFPSGHTSASYLSVFAFAYATPERYAEFLTRAAQMGENRIVTGMHSPLDVIGARIQATAMTAYALNKEENKEVLEKAYENAGKVFGALAEEKGMSLYEYAHTVTEEYTFESAYDETHWENHDANKAFYREKLTYGLPQTGVKGLAPVVPEGAEALLETRQPYLTDEQRREVLYTTAIDSGYPVLDESNGWGRMDLVTAADGYGAFLSNVTVDMDASKGRFNAQDWWRNDISGSGMLTKKGTGTLVLTGDNSYTGGTLLQGGALVAESATAFGKGDLYVENGTIVVDADGALQLAGNLTMDDGVLEIAMDQDSTQLTVGGILYIDGGELKLDFSNYAIEGSKEITLMTANTVAGKFDSVTADGYEVSVTYEKDRVIAHIQAK